MFVFLSLLEQNFQCKKSWKKNLAVGVLHAPSRNSLLSCRHPRTACTYLNHQCTYAAQTKAVRNLAAFTFTGLSLPKFCCFLTCITTQKKQPEMPNSDLKVTKMWKSQVCTVKWNSESDWDRDPAKSFWRNRDLLFLGQVSGQDWIPDWSLYLIPWLQLLYSARRDKKPVLPHLSNLNRLWSLVFIAYEIKLETKKVFFIIILFSPSHFIFWFHRTVSSFTEYSEL